MKAFDLHGKNSGIRTTCVEFGRNRSVCFGQNPEGTVRIHTIDVTRKTRDVRVSQSINITSLDLNFGMYLVVVDNPSGLAAYVRLDDPAMKAIKDVLNSQNPHDGERLLAAATRSNSFPWELRTQIQDWIAEDAEADCEVPIGREELSDVPTTPIEV